MDAPAPSKKTKRWAIDSDSSSSGMGLAEIGASECSIQAPDHLGRPRRWRTASSEYRHCDGVAYGNEHEPRRQRHLRREPVSEPGDRRPQASRDGAHEAQGPEDQRDQEAGDRRADDVCSYRVRVRHLDGRYPSTTSALAWSQPQAPSVVGGSSLSLHALDSTHRALPQRSADFTDRDPMCCVRGILCGPAGLPVGRGALPARATTLPLVDRMADGDDGSGHGGARLENA